MLAKTKLFALSFLVLLHLGGMSQALTHNIFPAGDEFPQAPERRHSAAAQPLTTETSRPNPAAAKPNVTSSKKSNSTAAKSDVSRAKNPNVARAKNSNTTRAKNTNAAPVKNSNTARAKNSNVSRGKNSNASLAKNSNVARAKGSKSARVDQKGKREQKGSRMAGTGERGNGRTNKGKPSGKTATAKKPARTDKLTKPQRDLAEGYEEITGRKLKLTSGYRTADEQAAAMYKNFKRVGTRRALKPYRNKVAAGEIAEAFEANPGRPRKAIKAMASVIAQQISRDVYVSNHLRGRALDVRSWGKQRARLSILRQVARALGGRVLVEPTHFHVEL